MNKRRPLLPPYSSSYSKTNLKKEKEPKKKYNIYKILPILNIIFIIGIIITISILFSLNSYNHSGKSVVQEEKSPLSSYELFFILTPNESTIKMILPFKYQGEIKYFSICCRSTKGTHICGSSKDFFLSFIFNNTLVLSGINNEFVGASCLLKIN